MEKQKTRDEIENQYKWDLSKMYHSKQDLDKDISMIEDVSEEIKQMQGHIMDSSDSLYQYLKKSEILDRKLEQVYVYAHMLCDEDGTNSESQSLKIKTETLNDKLSEKLSFIRPEILSCSYDKVKEYIEEKEELKEYAFMFESLFRLKCHTLTKEEEQIVAMASNAFGTPDNVFYNLDNVDVHFGNIHNEENKEVELTHSNYIYYLSSKNRKVRKEAFDTLYKYYEQFKNTFASSLQGQIKENYFYSKVRKYKNPLEASLFSDNIDESVYHTLIETVHKNLDPMYDYMKLRKEILNLDEMHMYDIFTPLISSKIEDIPYEEAKTIIKEALTPLGKDYINDLQKAFDENWIDIYPNKGKKSGAYSWGTYDSNPYVCLNYDNTIDSVSTMAHELGHSMHSYYSNKNQNYVDHAYPIFLAEIASTVNEVLLNQYLYDHAKTKEEKILYLTELLDKVRTTIYRQTMFAEFEMIMHEKEEKGIPLTEKEFSDTYYKLNQLYYGDNIISDDAIRYEWARIPHFYTSFYVYKYATGLSSAITLAFNILENKENALEKYLQFLSSGGKNYPLAILKEAGVDMTSPKPIEKALDIFKQKLEELKNLYQ